MSNFLHRGGGIMQLTWQHIVALVMIGVIIIAEFAVGAFLLFEIWWHG